MLLSSSGLYVWIFIFYLGISYMWSTNVKWTDIVNATLDLAIGSLKNSVVNQLSYCPLRGEDFHFKGQTNKIFFFCA